MTIDFHYTELMPYQIPVLLILATKYEADVAVFRLDKYRLTLYVSPTDDGVTYYERFHLYGSSMMEKIGLIDSDVIYNSGCGEAVPRYM